MKYLKIIKAFILYNLKVSSRYYSENGEIKTANIQADALAQKASKGRYGFVGVRNYGHICKICNVKFWTEKKEGDTCNRWKCYKQWSISERH